MPEIKDDTVLLWEMHPKIVKALEIADRIHVELTGSTSRARRRCALVTSGRDGVHSVRSLHYAGRAVDLRSKDLETPEKTRILSAMRSQLGPDYDVLLEYEGRPHEHFHIEYDPD